jgi:hypothetical protein
VGTASAGAAVKTCTCEELREYLKDVEDKLECYKQAYHAGTKSPFLSEAAQKGYIETCMGWAPGSAVSEGKPESASPQEQADAYQQCLQSHCPWICDGSIKAVHEKYHSWFDKNARMQIAFAFLYAVFKIDQPAVEAGTARMQQENILGEIGAHDMESRFLREELESAERDGRCSDVQRTVPQAERDRRIKDSYDRSKKYLDSLAGGGS